MPKLELIIVSLLLDRVQVGDLPVTTCLLPVLAGLAFSLGRPPEKTHSKGLFDQIQINITLIIYDTASLSTHEGLPLVIFMFVWHHRSSTEGFLIIYCYISRLSNHIDSIVYYG